MENKKNLKSRLASLDTRKYDLFIFDFDGTLVHPLEIDWSKMKHELYKHFKIGIKDDNKMKISKLLYEIKNLGTDTLEMAYKMIREHESYAISKAVFRKELKQLIDKIDSYKYKKICIFSSNMDSTIKKILARFALLDKIDFIVSKEDVSFYKPHPQGLLLILEKYKIPKTKAIYIGNTNNDLISGKSADIKTIIL